LLLLSLLLLLYLFFSFNQALDEVFIKPAAKSYEKIMPSFFKDRLSDFFSNLGDVATGANQLLQFRFDEGFETVGRVAVNSTVGLGGLFDVASEMNLKKGDEDFGQTMGAWGIGLWSLGVGPWIDGRLLPWTN
jgi:phospholipid-binding lipoprotein MlaA